MCALLKNICSSFTADSMFGGTTRKTSNGAPPPGPTCFSLAQMSSYLGDLRTNRPTRPTGARPLPESFGRKATVRANNHSGAQDGDAHILGKGKRSASGDTHQTGRNVSTGSNSSARLVSLYNQKDERQKQERKVSHEISEALKKLDLVDEEERIHTAAKEEADELIRKHLNPMAPYRPKPLSISRRRTSGKQRGDAVEQHQDATTFARAEAVVIPSMQERPVVVESGREEGHGQPTSGMPDIGSLRIDKQRSPVKFDPFSISNLANRRRSSGSKRLASGGSHKSLFVDPADKIYEDPNDRLATKPESPTMPAHVRRNPFARLRSKREAPQPSMLPSARISRAEQQNSLPSQARDAGYVRNDTEQDADDADASYVPQVNDREVRSDELRAATSMRFKDRSAKLPTPTGFSDSPGRHIVSFKPDWAPPTTNIPPGTDSRASARPSPIAFHVKTGLLTEEPTERSSLGLPRVTRDSPPPFSGPQDEDVPFIIVVNVDDVKEASRYHNEPVQSSSMHNPTFNLSIDVPSFNFTSEDDSTSMRPQVTNTSDEPSPSESSVSMSSFPIPPLISTTQPDLRQDRRRGAHHPVLPHRPAQPHHQPDMSRSTHPHHPPQHFAPLSPPQHTTTSSSPSRFTSIRHRTATCAHCSLPISGRVVTAAISLFHPSCFLCYHCATPLEHSAFYPEPSAHRAARLERIKRRRDHPNEHYYDEETEAKMAEDDGWDDAKRFYCHLDYHEQFSPRCKSCKTPIEGEVIVALGAEWHVGHFFCAECGDVCTPFPPLLNVHTLLLKSIANQWTTALQRNNPLHRARQLRLVPPLPHHTHLPQMSGLQKARH